MKDEEVLQLLCEAAPPVIAKSAADRQRRCVMATAIGLDGLAAIEVPAEPFPCDLTILNKGMVDSLENDQQDHPSATGAWGIGIDDTWRGDAFNGHLMIYVR